MSELTERCTGRWPEILMRTCPVAISSALLAHRDVPCPTCGGKDRFRFGDKGGRGTWFCHGERLGGDGVALVMRIRGLAFS